jgi:hypothetical protein
MSPFVVMQHLHIIHGRPSWSSSFIIAMVNCCGRFSPLRFETQRPRAIRSLAMRVAKDLASGQELQGSHHHDGHGQERRMGHKERQQVG